MAALLGLLACASAAAADEVVSFTSAAGGIDVRGTLARPEGRGPFPAVVLLHSCLGLPANRQSIEDQIAGWGYVALFVDDFGPRGLKETCTVDFPEGASDAFGALAFLARLGSVDSSEDRRGRLFARRRHGARDRGIRAQLALGDPGGPHVQGRGGFLSALRQPVGRRAADPDPHSRGREGLSHPGGGLRGSWRKGSRALSDLSSIPARITASTSPNSPADAA